MKPVSIAEQAVRAFEQVHGLWVVVHDLNDRLLLPASRFLHDRPPCRQVKTGPHGWRCYAFEVTRLRATWRQWPHGRVHCCHAGMIEWMVPVSYDDELVAVLFAGQARAETACCDVVEARSPATLSADDQARLLPTHPDHAPMVLELLRQLAARLRQIMADAPSSTARQRPVRTRRAQIDRFIHERSREPGLAIADLAVALHLSPGRTAHVVRDLYGQTFVQMLTAARLTTACQLLHTSDWSVLAVADAAGFSDLAHFHRVFKQHLGTTPRRYRQAAV